MKKLSIAAVFASLVFAKSFTLMPYGAYMTYSGTTSKDYGYVGGIYMSYYDVMPKYNSGLKWELNLENDYISYSGSTKDYRSLGATFIGNWYYGYNYAFKAGVNHQQIDNSGVTEHSNVYIIGAKYYKYLKYNVGVDYYKSIYEKSTGTLNINQISPYGGINFGNYYSKLGSFYAEAKINFIFSNKYLASKKDYTNIDLLLSNYRGKYTTTLRASFGKSAYKVANGGFVFYNTGDEYKSEYGIDVSYAYNPTTSIKVSYSHANFTDTGDAESDTVMISLIKGFSY